MTKPLHAKLSRRDMQDIFITWELWYALAIVAVFYLLGMIV